MKIIMMAAGKGTRLGSANNGKAKSLINFDNGKTLLDMQIDSMEKSGVIDEVIMILGFQNKKIQNKIKLLKKNKIKIKTVLNPFYETTNNLVSLWCAKSEMNDEFLITNGDNYFIPDVFKQMKKNTPKGYCLAISVKDKKDYGSDHMKIRLSNKKNVIYASKLIGKNRADAISTGLFMVSGKKHAEVFKKILDDLLMNKKNHNKFWLEGLNQLHKKGFVVKSLEFYGKKVWKEIDFPEDIEKAKALLRN